MKFIHTADWHLGNAMHDIDRRAEQEAFLAWLKGQIVETGAEALIVSGDIFDTPNPPTESRKQYYSFLASLIQTPCKNVIIIGGNHDSGILLDAPMEILSALNIQVVGTINNKKPSDLVKTLKDALGNDIGFCCAIPFTRDLELGDFGDIKKLYGDCLAIADSLRNGRNLPIIATGHLYAAGLEGRNSANPVEDGVKDIIGNLGNVSIDTFSDSYDYVALGHIHYTTKVSGNPKVWYSGSPFVMGFDECKIPRKILEVAADMGAIPTVKGIEVPKFLYMEHFEGSLEELRTQIRALANEPEDRQKLTYIDLLLTKGEPVNLSNALENEIKDKPYKVVRYRIGRQLLNPDAAALDDAIESLDQFDNKDYFRMLISSKNMGAKEEEIQKIFDDYLPLFNEAVSLAENGDVKEG